MKPLKFNIFETFPSYNAADIAIVYNPLAREKFSCLHLSGADVDFLSRRVMAACNQDVANQLSPLLNHVEFKRD